MIHATGFILKPGGTIITHSIYASGLVGRLRAEDCIRLAGVRESSMSRVDKIVGDL